MTGYREIEVIRHGAVAQVTLAAPASLNAASPRMVEELIAAFELCSQDGARALVLTGAGDGFCSGARLSIDLDVDAPDYDAGLLLETHYNPLMLAIKELSMPIVTAVNGVAAGAGCGLALAGDFVIAATGAYFLQPFRRVGLVPDSGCTYLLTQAIGRVRASELLMLGKRLDAATALQWGLINRVVPIETLVAEALALATDLASGPTFALAAVRRQCWAANELSLDAMLDLERAQQQEAGRTADHREGLAAFLEKRQPRFCGF